MTPDERRMLGELATELLSAGRTDELVAELVGSGLAGEVWTDDAAVALLFGAQGAAAFATTLLDHYALRPDGELPGRLVLPPPGTRGTPGRWAEGSLTVDGIVLAAGDGTRLAVGTDTGDVVLVDPAALEVVATHGFDPDLGVARVTGTAPHAAVTPLPASNWDTVAARVNHALACGLLGVAQAALDRAIAHVLARHQFGRPLAAFQVVRHRLAGAAIAHTGAEELVTAAGPELDPDVAGLVVKAAAGRAALLALAEAQQVCGGMGFTAEFGLHRLVRRGYLLDSLFGGAEAAEFDAGAAALASGRVPEPPVPLWMEETAHA